MVFDGKWFLSNSLCVFYSFVKAREWKTQNSWNKKSFTIASHEILYIYIFYIVTLSLFHFIMQTLLHPNGRSYRIIFVIRILEQDESTWVLSFKFYCNYIAFHDYSDWMASYEYNHPIDVLSNKIYTYWLLAWYLAKNKAVSI